MTTTTPRPHDVVPTKEEPRTAKFRDNGAVVAPATAGLEEAGVREGSWWSSESWRRYPGD
ncbi:MAG: hypothetical protein QM692_09510 [Thermomicrobiales bacterium]